MNKLLRISIISAVLILGCASEKSDFSKAKKENNIRAYETFLQKYPQGKYEQEATDRIHELAFQLTKQKDSLHVYREFKQKYPVNKFSVEIDKRIEELEYQIAKQEDSLHVYREFRQKYPESIFSVEVDKRIEQLAYQLAEDNDDMQSYQDFLKEFPASKYVHEIKKRIHNLSIPTWLYGHWTLSVDPSAEHSPSFQFEPNGRVLQKSYRYKQVLKGNRIDITRDGILTVEGKYKIIENKLYLTFSDSTKTEFKISNDKSSLKFWTGGVYTKTNKAK